MAHLCHICVMLKTEILRTRVDANKRAKAEEVFLALGISTGEAINIFLSQVAIQKGIPFSLTTREHLDLTNASIAQIERRYQERILNQKTQISLAENLENTKRHKTVKTLLKSLRSSKKA